MNYYPSNFYSNYPYQNNYSSLSMQQQPQQMQIPAMQNILNGKVVDSIEVAKVTDVPFGGYGIFPKADLSEVYIKSWNNNGTTNVMTFKPVLEGKVTEEKGDNNDSNNQIIEKIEQLDKKIDAIIAAKSQSNQTVQSMRKELNANAY